MPADLPVPQKTNARDDHSWPGTIAFWVSLAVASACYAAVAISPKLLSWLELREQISERGRDVASLETEIAHLRRVTGALQSDPQFTRELARVEFSTPRKGREIIRADAGFSLSMKAPNPPPQMQTARPAYFESVQALATQHGLRRGLLLLAAGLVVIAFGFFPARRHG